MDLLFFGILPLATFIFGIIVGYKNKTKKVQQDFKGKKDFLFFLSSGIFFGNALLIFFGILSICILINYFITFKIATYIGEILR
jgi:hypothetical protein